MELKPKHDRMWYRIRPPSYRHAAPSGPWPWMDIDSDPEPDPTTPHPPPAYDGRWTGYPQSHFPNWKPNQVKRCGMKRKVDGKHTCVIRCVDVKKGGQFCNLPQHSVSESEESKGEFWELMQKERPNDIRVRALVLDNLSFPVLQMLGTKYNVEPFFFSSSLNWIPSRYQEEPLPGEGDHITITLTFLRAMKLSVSKKEAPENRYQSTTREEEMTFDAQEIQEETDQEIDMHAPLPLRFTESRQRANEVLLLEHLAVHVIRRPDSSTIISYHPPHEQRDPAHPHASAERLYSRIDLAGQSVYWQKIFQKSQDPTFVLLTILWFALYAWDEALETLWEYISQLELSVLRTNNLVFTRELHKIRAHLLHYKSRLNDFHKSVTFVRDTPNPAMDSPYYDDETPEASRELLQRECKNLLMEIERLSMTREAQEKRLKNVLNLVFSSVNIDDSKRMQALTEAAVRDSAAMKQIAYLTMVFLPASFCAGVFGMNIKEINSQSNGTLAHYFQTAIPLTAVTIWIILAFHGRFHSDEEQNKIGLWTRLSWPFFALVRLIGGRVNEGQDTTARELPMGFGAIRKTPAIRAILRDGELGRRDAAV